MPISEISEAMIRHAGEQAMKAMPEIYSHEYTHWSEMPEDFRAKLLKVKTEAENKKRRELLCQ